MPATYTHHLFTKDIFKVLPSSVTDKFQEEENLYYLFGKSFDILFFINHSLGSFAHTHHVNLYFQNIIQYIRKNNLKEI